MLKTSDKPDAKELEGIPKARRQFYEQMHQKAPNECAELAAEILKQIENKDYVNSSHLGSLMLKKTHSALVSRLVAQGVDPELIGRLFGLLTWKVIAEDNQLWILVSKSDAKAEISGTEYFRPKESKVT
jgi:hypothetical protein